VSRFAANWWIDPPSTSPPASPFTNALLETKVHLEDWRPECQRRVTEKTIEANLTAAKENIERDYNKVGET
jgi:hypothetical protein